MKKIVIVLLLVVWAAMGLANPVAPNFFNELLFNSEGWVLEVNNLDYGFNQSDSLILRPIILQSGTDTVTTTNFTISADSLFFIINSSDIGSVFTLNPEGDDLQVGLILDENWIWTEKFTYGPNGTIAAPRPGQSICFGQYHNIDVSFPTYYLDNSPTIAISNDIAGACGQASGLVVDPYGIPIPNVEISTPFHESESGWPFFAVSTDSAGQFEFNTISFRWRLNIENGGYQSQTLDVQIWPDSTIELNIVLQPGPEYFQSFFPLQVGNIWKYKKYINGTFRSIDSIYIEKTVNINDMTYYLLGPDTVRYDSLNNIVIYKNQRDSLLYPLSLSNGDSMYVTPDSLWMAKLIYDQTPITVEAGTFTDNVILSFNYMRPILAIFITPENNKYFSRNVGLVKSYQREKTGTVTTYELYYAYVDGTPYGPHEKITPSSQLSQYRLQITNYPNPFNSSTTLKYHLPETGDVRLSVFDLSGRLVEELFSGRQTVGDYHYLWSGKNLPSGVYLISLQAGDQRIIQKCMLVK